MKKTSFIISGTAFLLALVCFAFDKKDKIDQFDIEVRINKEFNIELYTNPSTGYQWSWTNKRQTRLLDSVRRVFVSNKPVRPGTGGKDIWTFKALKKGTDSIVFEYKRPWSKSTNSGEKRTYRVRVY